MIYGWVLGNKPVTYDLSNTKITNFWVRKSGSSGGDVYKFPSTIEYACLQNVGTANDYTLDENNKSLLVNLTKIESSNCNWATFWKFCCNLPSLTTIDYYCSGITSGVSLSTFIDGLRATKLTDLTIRGYYPNMSVNTCGYDQLNYISQLTSLTKLTLQNMGGLKNFSFINTLTELRSLKITGTGLASLSFIKNLTQLNELLVYNNSGLVLTGFDETGLQVNNLELLKDAFSRGLRTVDISATGITAEEVTNSEIKKLQWTRFKS